MGGSSAHRVASYDVSQLGPVIPAQSPHVKEGFVQAIDAQKAQVAMFSNPNMAMDMMKKNLSMVVPQVRFF
jgi:hypothetical protein